ncbi:hypothetical protein AVHM3334_15665 [Acidovorax sp. SUPP3334]|nr:hypothetical protein AVHM3334_15665 [Acidovorax sp. SUPP3334]
MAAQRFITPPWRPLTFFHFDQPDLVTRPLSLPGLTRQIYLVRRRDRSLSMAAQAMYALVMEHRP